MEQNKLQPILQELLDEYEGKEITRDECILEIHKFLFSDEYNQPKLVWQRSTKAMPDIWITSTDEEHERGQHLTKFLWRQVEK